MPQWVSLRSVLCACQIAGSNFRASCPSWTIMQWSVLIHKGTMSVCIRRRHKWVPALVGGVWSKSGPGRFTPRKIIVGIHWLTGQVGSTAGFAFWRIETPLALWKIELRLRTCSPLSLVTILTELPRLLFVCSTQKLCYHVGSILLYTSIYMLVYAITLTVDNTTSVGPSV